MTILFPTITTYLFTSNFNGLQYSLSSLLSNQYRLQDLCTEWKMANVYLKYLFTKFRTIFQNPYFSLRTCVDTFILFQRYFFRTMYLLGYIPKDNRLYLGDKELNIVSYSLLVSVLEYQTAVMRRDFSMADKVLPTIPKEQRTRVAHFLEKQVSWYLVIAVDMGSL